MFLYLFISVFVLFSFCFSFSRIFFLPILLGLIFIFGCDHTLASGKHTLGSWLLYLCFFSISFFLVFLHHFPGCDCEHPFRINKYSVLVQVSKDAGLDPILRNVTEHGQALYPVLFDLRYMSDLWGPWSPRDIGHTSGYGVARNMFCKEWRQVRRLCRAWVRLGVRRLMLKTILLH